MTAILHWLPEASQDLQRLHTFIAAHNTIAAKKAVQKLVEAAETLIDFPEKGRPWDSDMDYRELTVSFGARAYIIRYRVFENTVIIVRIWHGLEDR